MDHLFRSLQHFLEGQSFSDMDEVEEALTEFFDSKSEKFFRDGIDSLPERWEQCVMSEGAYFE